MMSYKRKSLSIGIMTVLLAVMLFSPALAQGTDDAEPQVIITQIDTSRFPAVTVYISVTDENGEPVGIDPGRLVIQENGVTIQPDQMQGNAGVVDALTTMLVMDVSGSMYTADKLDTAKEAAKAYIDQMRSGDQAGLMSFNTEVVYVEPLTPGRRQFEGCNRQPGRRE